MHYTVLKLGETLISYDSLRKPLSSIERLEFQGEYPYYGAQEIVDYVKEYKYDGQYMLIAEDGENLVTRKKPIASIVEGKFWVNNHAHVVKTNNLTNIFYVQYLLNSTNINGYITGAAQPKLNQKNLYRIKALFPDKEYQDKIARYLYNYDKLIKNNIKQIQILEKCAQDLYKEWFVKFRFPGCEKVSFKSEKPIGWIYGKNHKYDNIPTTWKYSEFHNIGSFVRGKNITAAEMLEGEVPVISAGLEPSGYHNNYNVIGPSITISASGANAGFLSYHQGNIWAADCSYYSNEDNLWFAYNTLKFLQPVITNMQVGSAQPHVYAKNINRLNVLIPDQSIINLYELKVKPFYEEIKLLTQKNKNLIKQRDSLLPRLLSGKLSVEGKEII